MLNWPGNSWPPADLTQPMTTSPHFCVKLAGGRPPANLTQLMTTSPHFCVKPGRIPRSPGLNGPKGPGGSVKEGPHACVGRGGGEPGLNGPKGPGGSAKEGPHACVGRLDLSSDLS